jgi:putative nucleotidyltransferase with HDIG domain
MEFLRAAEMNRIVVIADTIECARDLAAQLSQFFAPEAYALDALPDAAPGQFTFVDINLRDPGKVVGLKAWLKRRPADGQVIFGIHRDSHVESIQAYAVGATDVIRRPVDARKLAWKLANRSNQASQSASEADAGIEQSVASGVDALEKMFAAVLSGGTPDLKLINAAGAEVVDSIEEDGLGRWLDVVRNHHSQTYQHCLVVTAVAVAFGRHLGFSKADKQRLAAAGLLHDVGKAKIPLEILEKPAPLNSEELAVMKHHPSLGFEVLKDSPGLQPEMLDMVVHHHEYLDGSGYPHGLSAREISDLVRTITIADIYGALIERRSYKPPLSGDAAYQILRDMGSKLDKDLVREFRALTQDAD